MKRLLTVGGLGVIVGFLGGCLYYIASGAINLAFGVDTDKNLVSDFIETKFLKGN